MNDKKTPGPNGIANEVLKLVFKCNLDLLLSVFNTHLTVDVFRADK